MWHPVQLTFSTLPLGADCTLGITLRLTQLVIPTNPTRIWLLTSCIPTYHYRCRTRPGTTRRSTLTDWATRNRFRAMCFITYTFAVTSGSSHSSGSSTLDITWSIWVMRRISVCSHHIFGITKFAALATHATKVRLTPKLSDITSHCTSTSQGQTQVTSIVQCVHSHIQAQETQAGTTDPYECHYITCTDWPTGKQTCRKPNRTVYMLCMYITCF